MALTSAASPTADGGFAAELVRCPEGSGTAEILMQLRHAVLSKVRTNRGNTTVVGIAGAGCVGKTTLSHRLSVLLGSAECQVVSLDAYLLDRQTRSELGQLTGYDPRGFELSRAAEDLETLVRNRRSVVVSQYNRLTHRRDLPEHLWPRRILLVEGGLALSDPIRSLIDLRIFLQSDKRTQYVLRLRREQAEFGSSESEVLRRFKRYWADYRKYIDSQLGSADLILRVGAAYDLVLVKGAWRLPAQANGPA